MTSTRKQLVEKAAKAILDANDVQPDDPDGDHGYYMQTWKYAVQDADAALAVFEAASLSVSDGSLIVTDPDHSELLANVASSDEQEALLRTIINAPESGDALHVAEAKRVRDAVLAAGFHRTVQAEPTPGKRLDPDFRADLVDAAKHRIEDVWTDVPGGVESETLAQNVVAAQEFLWIARGFPVAKVQGEPSNVSEPGVSDISSAQMSVKAEPSLRDHVRNLTGASDAELDALGGFTGEPSDAGVKAALDEYLRGETAGKVRAMRSALRAAAAVQGGER